jgi:hypothetical protein
MNIILTGLPRSGSSMLCVLMSKHPDVVALNEGLKLGGHLNVPSMVMFVAAEFDRIRDQILTTGTAPARHKDGQQVDNHFSPGEDRKLLLKKSNIDVGQPATETFGLAFKHNAAFLMALPGLVDRFGALSVIATIRNPLSVLGSWGSVPVPVSEGRIRHAKNLAPELEEQLKSTDDLLEKQLLILNYYFSQFQKWIPREQIIRYEDLCGRPVETLGRAFPQWDWTNLGLRPTANRNASPDYSRDRLKIAAARLQSTGPDAPWREFYSDSDIQQITKSLGI